MPSWKAAMKRDGSATILRTMRARLSPSLTSSSSRVWRTDTNAYSADTKNAFQRMQKTIRTSSIPVRKLIGAVPPARGGSPAFGATLMCLPGCGAASRATPGACSYVIDRFGSPRARA